MGTQDHQQNGRQGKSKWRRLGHFVLLTLMLLTLAILVGRVFVGDVYPVSSSSMRPTIYAGVGAPGEKPLTEWVFVSFDRSTPDRFGLAVLRPEEGGEPLVKRVLGLAGESLRLVSGDLYVDGAPLGFAGLEQRLIPLWDSSQQPWQEWLSVERTPSGPWRERDGKLILDALEQGSSTAPAMLLLDARDGYLSPEGVRVPGVFSVNDLVLGLTFTIDELAPEAGARLGLWLTEAGDVFLLTLEQARHDSDSFVDFDVALDRMTRADFDAVDGDVNTQSLRERLAHTSVSLRVDQQHVLMLYNWDDELRAVFDGDVLVSKGYGRNQPLERQGVSSDHVPPRAGFFGAGMRAQFERIRILRDLFWIPKGDFAVSSELLLAPDEIFVLGDNSRASVDSRSFGPMKVSRVSGRVEAVVWPPGRLQRLSKR